MQLSLAHKYGLLAGASLWVALLAGCGSSAYEELGNRRYQQIKLNAPFMPLWGYTQMPDAPVKIRVPRLFAVSFFQKSNHPNDRGRIAAGRVQPPFLQLPGFQMCYEVKPQNGMPMYCYLAATPAAGDLNALAADLQKQLKRVFPEKTPDAWESVECPSPTGQMISWKKIRVLGEQPFDMADGPPANFEMKAGVFELWLHDGGQWFVIVGWRIPNDQLAFEGGVNPNAFKLDKLAPLTAGTVVVGQAMPEAPADPAAP
jgi:hypothetical protein